MKKSKILGSVGTASLAALTLAACGKSNDNNAEEVKKASKFPTEMPKKATKQGGTVKFAIENDSPFTGIFASELSTTKIDSDVASPGNESLFDVDDDYKINDKGPATLKINRKNNTVTITLKKGVK